MSAATIKLCKCSNEFQDECFGRRMRVHNAKKDGSGTCTVCGDVKSNLFKATSEKGGKGRG